MRAERFERLGRATSALLDPDGSFGSWRTAAIALFDLFTEIAPLPSNEMLSADHDGSILATGTAISTVDAARCILDFQRTRTFLIGVERAMRSVERRPVHVLYAGTGPFAPLVVPLTTMLDPDDLQVTLLDVHHTSVDRLGTVVGALGLQPYVDSMHLTDATVFDPGELPPVDVLVVEAMQRALTKEPQVAIVRHLLGRLPERVQLVPDAVIVSARFAVPGAARGDRDDLELGEVVRLDEACIRSAVGDVISCATRSLDVQPRRDQVLTLDTRVRVGRGLDLSSGSSGLTLPHQVRYVEIDCAPAELRFHYRIDYDPGLVCAVA